MMEVGSNYLFILSIFIFIFLKANFVPFFGEISFVKFGGFAMTGFVRFLFLCFWVNFHGCAWLQLLWGFFILG